MPQNYKSLKLSSGVTETPIEKIHITFFTEELMENILAPTYFRPTLNNFKDKVKK